MSQGNLLLFTVFFFMFRRQAGWFRWLHDLRHRHVVAPKDIWPAGQHPVHVLRPVCVCPPLFLLKRYVLPCCSFDSSFHFIMWRSYWSFIPLCSVGIPFMYRGLPCIYSSAILASASLLSGGNMAMLRVIAMAMILFMISQNFYPHDRVLESQAWKKAVYAGGKASLLKAAQSNDSKALIHSFSN